MKKTKKDAIEFVKFIDKKRQHCAFTARLVDGFGGVANWAAEYLAQTLKIDSNAATEMAGEILTEKANA